MNSDSSVKWKLRWHPPCKWSQQLLKCNKKITSGFISDASLARAMVLTIMSPSIAEGSMMGAQALLLFALLIGTKEVSSFSAAAPPATRPHVVVIGGGWGGYGAAKGLVENDCRVTLLDVQKDPTGNTPMLTPTGKPFEPGTRGFWMDYPNINDLVKNDLKMEESQVFTDFTTSCFYSPQGLEATAPVFSSSNLPQLPSPAGQLLATLQRFERLPIVDRASIVGLLYSILDFDRSEDVMKAYDRMTAHELFIRMGLSKRLVDDFVRPTLLVGLFKPPEELSAAVAMELLYFYALAHQSSFDVRWIKAGTVASSLIAPLASLLESCGPGTLEVKGGSRVTSLEICDQRVNKLRYTTQGGEERVISDVDACVLAVGAGGMKAIVRGSPELARLAPELASASTLGGIDVMSCRFWLDKTVATRAPANVLSQFSGLRGSGGTFFMLDQLQEVPEGTEGSDLWGGETARGSVVACDFYNAGALLALSDSEISRLLMEELLPAAVPGFRGAGVVDSHVQRYPSAVSWFSPGSYSLRPPLKTSVSNVVVAGDWVRMGAREHGAKGLCQERAYVSGLEAANELADAGVLGSQRRRTHPVIPVRPDEPQVQFGRAVNKSLQGLLAPLGLDSPWVR
jgi:uncharacterized protein with NAD-binding domain and iron-sulfur cluster